MSVSVFLHIDTGVILICDIITTDHSLSDATRNDGVLGFKVVRWNVRY